MKQSSLHDKGTRFNGSLRSHHRAHHQENSSWDEWVEGKPSGSKSPVNWLKIILIGMAVLALGGIIAGLIIELG